MGVRAVAWLVVLGTAVPASAHKSPAERRMVVQVDDTGAAALVELDVGGGEALLLAAMYDVDRDGALSPVETQALAAVLVDKALRGVGLRWDGVPLRITKVTPRLSDPTLRSSKVAAVALVELALPFVPADGSAHRLSVAVAAGEGNLNVNVQALGAFRVAPTNGQKLAPDGRGLAAAIDVVANDTVDLLLVRTNTRAR